MRQLGIVRIAGAALFTLGTSVAFAGTDGSVLTGGFGRSASKRPSAAYLANGASGAVTISSGPAAPAAPAVPSGPCVVRDPEDGGCYASADAADLAWLARGPLYVSADIANVPAPSAEPELIADAETDDGIDATEDEADEAEDGGALAPVDTGHEQPDAPVAKPSLWKRFTERLTGLVVRKSDSRPVSLPEDELASLLSGDLPLPIEDYPQEKLNDSFYAPRGKHRRHHAIDLPANSGTPVIAVVNGTVERIGRDRFGGKVVYLRDRTNRFTFYYAHLSRFARGLRNGDAVRKGQTLGYVGATGRASGPHLHFAIFRDSEQQQPQQVAATPTPQPLVRAFVVNPYLIFAGISGRR